MRRSTCCLLALVFVIAGLNLTNSASLSQELPGDAARGLRFTAVEIWLDSGDEPLAAYQLDFKPVQGHVKNVKIVGIEGGEHAEFSDAPYYDPKAMMGERVIIAAYSTAVPRSLPVGRTRIATIHVQVSGDDEPRFEARTAVSAGADGTPIQVNVELSSKGQS